jgi:hypothetical protein
MAVVAGLVVVVLGALAVVLFSRPEIPAAAPRVVVDRTALASPDPNESLDPSATSWIVQTDCADRVDRARGYVDLCWVVTRQQDVIADRDHYSIAISGTFGGESVRWLVVEARPDALAPNGETEGLPEGTATGCRPVPLGEPLPPGTVAGEELCGRIAGGPGATAGSWRVTWMCEPCLPFDDEDRAFSLRSEIFVPEGTLPNWEILADLGG